MVASFCRHAFVLIPAIACSGAVEDNASPVFAAHKDHRFLPGRHRRTPLSRALNAGVATGAVVFALSGGTMPP